MNFTDWTDFIAEHQITPFTPTHNFLTGNDCTASSSQLPAKRFVSDLRSYQAGLYFMLFNTSHHNSPLKHFSCFGIRSAGSAASCCHREPEMNTKFFRSSTGWIFHKRDTTHHLASEVLASIDQVGSVSFCFSKSSHDFIPQAEEWRN